MEEIIKSELRKRVMKHFVENPATPYYVRELAGILKVDAGNLSRELKMLEENKLLISDRLGRSKVYRINRMHSFFRQLQSIIDKNDPSLSLKQPIVIHGQCINSSDVKYICSRWDVEKFVSLCNSLLWGCIGRNLLSVPSFTERINVSDNGIDAECIRDVKCTDINSVNPFVNVGINAFQYKKRDMTSTNTDRRKVFTSLKNDLNGAIVTIQNKAKKSISKYLLFTNIDLSLAEKEELRKSITSGLSRSQCASNRVEIIGSAELSTFLNDVPHMRSAYFIPSSFNTWQSFMEKDKNSRRSGAWVDFIGRETILNYLKAIIDDPVSKAIVLYGPQGIGKTRLLIEATKDYSHRVVVVNDPKHFTPASIGQLTYPYHDTIVILDGPSIEEANQIATEALALENIKLFIVLVTPGEISFPAFGFDKRVISLPVNRLSEKESDDLIKVTGYSIDFNLASWIKYHANGNPSILLAAAFVSRDLRDRTSNFIEEVGRHFANRVKKDFGEDVFLVLQLLSVLTYVGVDGDYVDELNIICELFSDGMSIDKIKQVLMHLVDVGLLNRKGSFVEIALPIFAIYLASILLESREDKILPLLVNLRDSGRKRFLKRIVRLDNSALQRFWREIFGSDGLFKDINELRENIRILHCISGAVPERTIEVIERNIFGTSIEERKNISGDFRRELVWTLDQLLFRRATSLRALRIMGLLAEAENEDWGNNASGIFSECFMPLHGQMPIPVSQRSVVLEEFAQKTSTVGLKLLSIRAIKSALHRGGSYYTVRHSDGFEPFEGMPTMTYAEIWDYMEKACDLLFELSKDLDEHVSLEAFDSLPDAIAELTIQGRSPEGLKRFELLRKDVGLDGKVNVTDYMGALNLAYRALSDTLQKESVPEEGRNDLVVIMEVLGSIKKDLEDGDFSLQIKRWSGSWTYADDGIGENEQGEYRYQVELKRLVQEVIDHPDLLSNDILLWLLSDDAQKSYAFFRYLGECDTDKFFLPELEKLADKERGAHALAMYCIGLKIHSCEFVKDYLTEIYQDRRVHPWAILLLISAFEASAGNIKRVANLIDDGALSPDSVERTLVGGRWIDNLSDDDFLVLLKAIAGCDRVYAPLVIDMLAMWLHSKRNITGELADFSWQCLETTSCSKRTRGDFYDYDEVAASLVTENPERAFVLAEKLIIQSVDGWNPIDRHGQRKFWSRLTAIDRRRALKLLLEICAKSPRHEFSVTWNLKEVLDQVNDKDLIIEFVLEDIRWAEILTDCLSTKKIGFWEVAIPIANHYFSNKRIIANLESGIDQTGFIIVGGFYKHYLQCHAEVERVLREMAVPVKARIWLEKVESRYRVVIENQKLREENEDVVDYFDYNRYLQDGAGDSLRGWAIMKTLQGPKWKEIIDSVSSSEIKEILSAYEFSEDRKKLILSEIKQEES